MGLDLRLNLFPNRKWLDSKSVYLSDNVTFDRDYRIFRQLVKIPDEKEPTIETHALPPQIWVEVYTNEGFDRRLPDENMVFVYAMPQLFAQVNSTTGGLTIAPAVEGRPRAAAGPRHAGRRCQGADRHRSPRRFGVRGDRRSS